MGEEVRGSSEEGVQGDEVESVSFSGVQGKDEEEVSRTPQNPDRVFLEEMELLL